MSWGREEQLELKWRWLGWNCWSTAPNCAATAASLRSKERAGNPTHQSTSTKTKEMNFFFIFFQWIDELEGIKKYYNSISRQAEIQQKLWNLMEFIGIKWKVLMNWGLVAGPRKEKDKLIWFPLFRMGGINQLSFLCFGGPFAYWEWNDNGMNNEAKQRQTAAKSSQSTSISFQFLQLLKKWKEMKLLARLAGCCWAAFFSFLSFLLAQLKKLKRKGRGSPFRPSIQNFSSFWIMGGAAKPFNKGNSINQLILKSWIEMNFTFVDWAAAYNAHFTMFNFMNLSLLHLHSAKEKFNY